MHMSQHLSMTEVTHQWLYLLHEEEITGVDSIVLVALQALFFIYQPVLGSTTDTNEVAFSTQFEAIALIIHSQITCTHGSDSGGSESSCHEHDDKSIKSAECEITTFEGVIRRLLKAIHQNWNVKHLCIPYKPGGSFGELALINQGKRAGTIKCHSECWLGILHKEDFMSSIGALKQMEIDRMVNFLKDLPHFERQARGKLKLYREYM